MRATRAVLAIVCLAMSLSACTPSRVESVHSSGVDESLAQPEHVDDCLDAETLDEMNRCRKEAVQETRVSLDELVGVLASRFQKDEPRLLKLLELAQAAWESHVKADCGLETYYSHDTEAYDAEYAFCLERKYLDRRDYIQRQMDQP